MGTTNDNLRKLRGRSDAKNPNLDKLQKYSRSNSVIPLTAMLKDVPDWKLKQVQRKIKAPIDFNGGQIDFGKYRRGNFDLLGKGIIEEEEVVELFSFGNGLRFNNTSTFVSDIDLDVTGDFGISYWVEFDSVSGVVHSGDGVGSENVAFLQATNNYRVFDSTASTSVNFNAAITLFEKTHLVLSYNSSTSTLTLYKNGVLVASSGYNGLTDLYILGARNGVDLHLDALLNEFAVCVGYAPTVQDAIDLYNSGNGEFATDVLTNVERYYRMNGENGDTVLIDEMGNKNANLNNFVSPYFEPWDNINIALAGQSNGTGRVDEVGRPADVDIVYPNSTYIKNGVSYEMDFGTDGINSASDLVGDFGVEWRITESLKESKTIKWLKRTVGGSSVGTDQGNGSWASNGGETNSIISQASLAGYTPDWLIWIQGETDAVYINDAANYQTNLEATFARFRTEWGADLKIIIVGLYDFTGVGAYASDVQGAQSAIAASQANTYIFNPATDAGVVGSDLLDTIHYNHSGIDKISIACYNIINSN